MSRKPSGEIKTSTVRSRQPNGDIYIYERTYKYDPEKQNTVILQRKLIAKIPKGQTEPVPTRAKRPNGEKAKEQEVKTNAQRSQIDMMDIIDHIGKISGIDNAIYSCTDTEAAQQIISLARYLFAANGQSLPGIETWQLNHPIPYEYGISEDVCHNLFQRIGRDETLQQNYFRERCMSLSKGDAIAYDFTVVSTHSGQQIEAGYGYNHVGDGLKTIKLLTLKLNVKSFLVIQIKKPTPKYEPCKKKQPPKRLPEISILIRSIGIYLPFNEPELQFDPAQHNKYFSH